MTSEAQGIPIAVPTIFENITASELLSTYKRAYLEAGFELKEETTHTDRWKRDDTHLVFVFSIPQHQLQNKGVASFNIESSNLSSTCAPCSVYAEVFGGEIAGAERQILLPKMLAARRRAESQIKAKLGKYIRSAPPDDLGSGVD